jgi:hypothetical protein
VTELLAANLRANEGTPQLVAGPSCILVSQRFHGCLLVSLAAAVQSRLERPADPRVDHSAWGIGAGDASLL